MSEHRDPDPIEKITDDYEQAEITRRWNAQGSSSSSSSSSSTAEQRFAKWSAQERDALRAVDDRIATGFDARQALDRAQFPGGTDPTPSFVGATARPLFGTLTQLCSRLDPLQRVGFGPEQAPAAGVAARRDGRDLFRVLGNACTAARSGLSKEDATTYGANDQSLNARLRDARDALDAWTKLLESKAEPSGDELLEAASAVKDALGRLGQSAITLAGKLDDADAAALMRDTVLLYVGAVGQEVGTQWAARGAKPSWGGFYGRLTETTPPSADRPDGNPSILFNDVQRRLHDAAGLSLDGKIATALKAVEKGTAFKPLGKALTEFLEQYGRYPNQDMGALSHATLQLAFGLERLRGDVTAAFAGASRADRDVRDYIVGSLDACFAHLIFRMGDAVTLLGGGGSGVHAEPATAA